MRPRKIECIDAVPELCGDQLCDLKVISRTDIIINLGCNILKPIKQVTFTGAIYVKIKTAFKLFGPVFTFDLCEAMKHRNNIVLNSIFKQVEERNAQVLHDCPYEGPHFVRNLTVSEAFGLSALPPGDYKIEVRLSNAQSNQTLIHTNMYFYVKATDPLKDFRNVFEFKF